MVHGWYSNLKMKYIGLANMWKQQKEAYIKLVQQQENDSRFMEGKSNKDKADKLQHYCTISSED